MKDFYVIVRNYDGRRLSDELTFLTRAKTIKSALRNLVNNSSDFNIISDKQLKLRIILEEMK